MSKFQSFDDYAASYRADMHDALGRFGGESSYYLSEKVRLLAHHLGAERPRQILDFGAGIGQAVPFLLNTFVPEVLVCTDESKESLSVLRATYPVVMAAEMSELDYGVFDLVFVANVLHHVEQSHRAELLADLCQRLSPGGVIAVFEHNPINPVTRRIVSNCAFDEGVVLLSAHEVKNHLRRVKGMAVEQAGYFLFVPEPLKKLNWLDGALRWLPMGGQHFVLARRS
jgi:trans-aconitate methyltransferase